MNQRRSAFKFSWWQFCSCPQHKSVNTLADREPDSGLGRSSPTQPPESDSDSSDASSPEYVTGESGGESGHSSGSSDNLPGTPPIAAMPTAVQGSQLTAIPLFTGDPSSDIEVWISALDRARVTFDWSMEATSGAAKSRLSESAAVWLQSQSVQGNEYAAWDTDAGFRKALRNRFKLTLNAMTAVDAITGLQQRSKETTDQFYDRVGVALDKKNYSYTAAQKAGDEYKATFLVDVLVMFCAGLKTEIREMSMQGYNPPTTAEQLRVAARNVEAQLRKKNEVVATLSSNVEVATEKSAAAAAVAAAADPMEALEKKVHALSSDFGRFRGNSRGRGSGGSRGRGSGGPNNPNNRCFNCDKPGHFSRQCRAPRNNTWNNNNNNNNNNNRGAGRGGYQNAGRGGGRNQYEINEEHGGGHYYQAPTYNYLPGPSYAPPPPNSYYQASAGSVEWAPENY